jgi:uncharacterized protein
MQSSIESPAHRFDKGSNAEMGEDMKARLGAALLLNALCVLAHAQAPSAGSYSPPGFEVNERRGVMVAMRDGVRLSANIYAPKSLEKLPAILFFWPNDNNDLRDIARWFAKRGYVFVTAYSRGRYDSEGEFDVFGAKNKTDGYDLVEWIAAQSWSNGKVGMIGVSVGSWSQWWTASQAPPHLAAIVPLVAPPDAFENAPYQNGVLTGAWVLNWAALQSGRTFQIVDKGRYGGWLTRDGDLNHTPYIDINAFRGMENAPWFEEWYRQNKSTDRYWQEIAYQGKAHYSQMTVPSLNVTGWFDANQPGAPMNYLGMKKYGATPDSRRPTIIIGPWTHDIPWTHDNNQGVVAGVDYGPEATIDLEGYITRWFDHYLKGINNGVELDPSVYVFVMGENKWHTERDWPLPEAKPTKFYFASNGHANSLNGNGLLTVVPPRRDAADSFVYDPRNPTRDPFEDYADHNGNIDGALDTQLSAMRDDVLVYQTPPLTSAVEVTGPIEAVLYAATSAEDTDWFIRLVDVNSDGHAMLLAEGAMRARNRDPADQGRFNAAQLSKIEPRRVYQYTIQFWRVTGNLFKRGHRIRVEISSSWFPYFLANLNTGADNAATELMADAVVARQTVTHGPRHPSLIVLPIVSRRPEIP